MGGNNSKTEDLNAKQNNKVEPKYKKMSVTTFPISEEQVRLVRDSWKEMTKLEDFKNHGSLMMVK